MCIADAIEFTVTIRTNNLAYLGWEAQLHAESTHLSLEELHTRFNHTPYLALRHLIWD